MSSLLKEVNENVIMQRSPFEYPIMYLAETLTDSSGKFDGLKKRTYCSEVMAYESFIIDETGWR